MLAAGADGGCLDIFFSRLSLETMSLREMGPQLKLHINRA